MHHSAQQEVLPLVHTMGKVFPRHCDISSGDRGSNVLRMERILCSRRVGVPRLCAHGCTSHNINIAQKGQLNIMKEVVSGIVAMTLTERNGNGSRLLRRGIFEVLIRSAIPHVGVPPPPGDSAVARHRDAILDLCIGGNKGVKAQQRYLVLRQVLQGDLRLETVDVYFFRDYSTKESLDAAVRSWAHRL